MKKLFVIIISVLIICSVAACSSDNDASYENDFTEIDATKLPSKVDLRNYDGKNYVTEVKSQRFGDCWTFSLAGSAEIAYLYANDLGVAAGEVNDKVDFSEKYIAWYMFHGITMDDVATGKVRASQIGEGFDPREAENKRELSVYFIGGPFVHYANLFADGFGPVDESVKINGEYPYAYDDSWTGEWTLPLKAEYRSVAPSASLRNSYVLPTPATFDADGNYALNADGINAIKSELYQGHGVSVALCTMHAGYNVDNRAAYYNGDGHPDHAVTVVGYDDDYPKENFAIEDGDGKVDEDSVPPENGALIIKNSWGLSTYEEDDLDDGYFYLSYYDHSLTSPMSYVFDGGDPEKSAAPNYDQYDLMMTNWYGSTDHDAETKMANIFDAEEDESLQQIAYRTSLPKTEVTYEIYKDVEDDDPSSGTLLEKGVSRHTYAGFYKIDLKDEYSLEKGEKYSVVLTMKRVTDEDGSMVYTEVFPYSTEFFKGMTVSGIINMGESYLYTDGEWRDMFRMKARLYDNAYEQCVEELRSNKALPELKLENRDKIAIDNYPIKAILAPAG